MSSKYGPFKRKIDLFKLGPSIHLSNDKLSRSVKT